MCVSVHACDFVCMCFCHILYEDVCKFLYVLYTCVPLIRIIMGNWAVSALLSVVKRFEISKALYKFPMIMIIIKPLTPPPPHPRP